VNYFNWQTPEKAQYPIVDWHDPDLESATGGLVPPYQNPDLDQLWGEEQRRTAGGGHAKGVMEKCTFCVQRVEKGLEPACVDTCPTDALVFGDIDDPATPISQYLKEKQTWQLLEDVGTRPSVYYVGGTPPNSEVTEIEQPKATV
jgi:molybdopterin-containing oxidoreductase family iron-sulfur binding subunit